MFIPRVGVLVTKGVILHNGMTGLERKVVCSFVRNVGGMLEEISVDQRKFVSHGMGFSQGTVERLPDREIQRRAWLGEGGEERV